ncbi:MAG: GT2 family glycosyltransferase [Gammaproteobacteria bacterium]|jgi:GT2 family glycosyltransferase
MIRFMDKNSDVTIALCEAGLPDSSYQNSVGLMFNLYNELIRVVTLNSSWVDRPSGNDRALKELDWLNADALFVRDEAVDAIGGLDEYSYTFLLDADYRLRIKQNGWRIVYTECVEILPVRGEHANLLRAHVTCYNFLRKHSCPATIIVRRLVSFLASRSRCVLREHCRDEQTVT